MINNFIGGGQVFLHKVRMFWQVFTRTIHIAFLVGIIVAIAVHSNELGQLDKQAFYSYRKAVLADSFDGAMNKIRASIGNKPNHITFVNAKTKVGIWGTKIDPRKVVRFNVFKEANTVGMLLCQKILIWSTVITLLGFIVIVFVWSKFGKNLKTDKIKDGENKVLTAKEVRKKLYRIDKASDLKIGDMPLVKDMETMNFLVSGSIGSGKTNLIHNLLPQVESRGEPAIIIDNTGEMIAKYYDPSRGDIIFNPFDERSHGWNFWHDCLQTKDLEKFADILIGFSSRKNNRGANDFWEESAASIFVACAGLLQRNKQHSIEDLYKILCQTESKAMYQLLEGTDAAKYFTKDNAKTAASIISVLMANIKPLRFLKDSSKISLFSIEEYINNINVGGRNWLFLSTDPSARELTIPLNAALLELFISRMRRTRTNSNNKLWIVMDELPSLGKLPSLPQLMQEGRKYGSCVVSGLQSTSQLYQHYGDADASNLIGLFKTKFAFASDDPRMGELYSKLCGTKTTFSQQKNTSFGANEFRDGVSYNEKKETSPLVSYEEFGKLNIGECYVLLPLASVRLSRIQVPEAKIRDKNNWFVEIAEQSIIDSQIRQEAEDDLVATDIQEDLNQDIQISQVKDDTADLQNNNFAKKIDDDFIFNK